MANRIQLRRGLKSKLPTGSEGEPFYTIDTREFFIGTGNGNVNMNGSKWYTGTAMSASSGSNNSYAGCPLVKVGDMYLNTSYGYVYECTTAGSGTTAKWTYKGSIKGATGPQGSTGATGASGTSAAWHTGTSISGTGTHTLSVSGAHAGDMYLNTSTGDVYEATSATSWTWKCNIKGPTGSQGPQGPAGTTAAKLTTPRAIDGVNFDGSGAITHYGVCSTSAATAAKTVNIPGFNLVTGAVVFVTFTYTNTVNTPTLNVTGTGAKQMKSQTGAPLNKNKLTKDIMYMFVYDGTSYRLTGALNYSPYATGVVIGGSENTAGGSNSVAIGGSANTASAGNSTCIGGMGNKALAYQTKIGFYSTDGDTSDYFIIGNGDIISESRSNAFRVTSAGEVYGKGAFNTSGADYAEFFEWLDGNPEGEDRIGLFVTLDGDKIRLANADDDYILGAVSGAPGVVGNNHSETWQGMWLTDIYGRVQKHTVHVEAKYDDDGNVIREECDVVEPIINPDYNPAEKYIPREDRPEWGIVGMMGQLVVIDDGTCEVNGCCKVADGGIAAASESGYRVIARIDDTHVKVLFR